MSDIRLDTTILRPAKRKPRVCLECGREFAPTKRSAEFCATACRKSFNNRRAMRGAILYDVVMASRYDRKAANDMGAWKVMCRMAMQFREEDRERRGGRRSWQALKKALADRPDLYATVIANDAAGTKGRLKWR